jgi:hypothetical protein
LGGGTRTGLVLDEVPLDGAIVLTGRAAAEMGVVTQIGDTVVASGTVEDSHGVYRLS